MERRDVAAGPIVGPAYSYVEWGAIVAGAVTAAAISFVLLTFGSAIGLSAVSPWPNSGIPWWLLAIIGALWFLIVQTGSYALGGYFAGRMRAPVSTIASDERQFRDGAHGFFVWALGVTISAIVVGITAGGVVKTGTDAASNLAAGAAQMAPAAMNTPALDPMGYAVDRLHRSAPVANRAAGTASADATNRAGSGAGTNEDARKEVGRIFAGALSQNALAPDDRAYLSTLAASRTGLAEADAQKQVDQAFALAQQAQTASRAAADKARKASAIGGFLIAASLLVAAAAAAAGGGLGGRHRDENGTLRFFGRDRFW